MSQQTYLSKNGKIFGPYPPEQIEVLKTKGEFFDYEWMWDGQTPDWQPVPRQLQTPPPLPLERTREITRAQGKVFCAVAFDPKSVTRHAVGGEVTQAHARGGLFISTAHANHAFPKGSHIWIDMLDEKTDKSAKVRCLVTLVQRQENRWIMNLEWDSCPLI